MATVRFEQVSRYFTSSPGAVIVVVMFCILAVAPLIWHGVSSL
jgi:hypothetical protein